MERKPHWQPFHGFWGKFDPGSGTFHPLEDHCVDVACVFRNLLDLPVYRRVFGYSLDPCQRDRLAVLAFLHDFGKCNWGFQAKADPEARETAGHVLEAAFFLLELQPLWPQAWQQLVTDLCGWFMDEENAASMLLAAISHHGRPVSLSDLSHSSMNRTAKRYWQEQGSLHPALALEALCETARRLFPVAFQADAPPIQATPALQHRFAGLLMLADWIGSDAHFFPFRASPAEDRFSLAQEAARMALRIIGMVPPEGRRSKGFEATFGFQPSPLQSALLQGLPVEQESRLLLVESDTGSGKTEAALAWFFRLYAQNQVDGLYFALPTRVAAREIYARVFRAVEAAFEPTGRPGPVLLAAPGYVRVDGQPALPDPVVVLHDDHAEERRRERLWAAERPKRFLAAPIAVGTIDQALLSVLQVKHSLLRSVCLDRHLLVVDEVHASDPYMREVLRALLRGHLQRGGWALLLSATLGEAAAASFFDRDPAPLTEAVNRPYPLITSRAGTHAFSFVRPRKVAVTLSPTLADDTALIPPLIAALQAGARVLVVCNTVSRANGLFRLVEESIGRQRPDLLDALFSCGGVRCPHHGRFAREDRERMDAAVSSALGKESASGGRLLIGTQTLEQSLDIDADWLISDLCPMDVLLQRIGRLHRHGRVSRPPGFAEPHCLVLVPSERDLLSYLRADGSLRGPAGLGRVYEDGRILQRTLDVIRERPLWELPRDSRLLVEETTHPEALDSLAKWEKHRDWIEGTILAQLRAALGGVLKEEPFGEFHYPDKSERVATRLGAGTLEIPLDKPAWSPFGVEVHRVLIPAHLLPPGEFPEEALHPEPFEGGFGFRLGSRRYRYTRFGLERDDA
jgi:CRISPR-associated endonuclease/helicase Cas3